MSIFGSGNIFSYRNLAFITTIAALFSWFVLQHVDASVFFAVSTVVALYLHTHSKADEHRTDSLYRDIDNLRNDFSRDQDAIYRYVDDRFEECNKSKR